ncbi:hypothetical protein [Parapedobacter tibetensis]|nr:hypothetical protein [Parapedobacter tibetensis]
MEAVKAKAAALPKFPKTIHYRGNGTFMVSGNHLFYPEKLKGM